MYSSLEKRSLPIESQPNRREVLFAFAQMAGAGLAFAGFTEIASQLRNHISTLSEEQRQLLRTALTHTTTWEHCACERKHSESFSTSLSSGEQLTVIGSQTSEGRLLEAKVEGGDASFYFKCMYHSCFPKDRDLISRLIDAGKDFEYSVPAPKLSSLQ